MQQTYTKQVGDYLIDENKILGKGSFSIVYLGLQKETGQSVAIKLIDLAILQDIQIQQAIVNEVNIQKVLVHENIVRLYDVIRTNNALYLVLEYCPNGSLGSLIKLNPNGLDEQEALRILKQILRGFQHCIKYNVIHRDLKPDNILNCNGIYKISDFGFAGVVMDFQKQKMNAVLGTPVYMSPQLLSDAAYTTKTDIWSIGIIYYCLLFGNPPWKANSEKELLQKIQSTPFKFPDFKHVSQESRSFISNCLVIDENYRIGWIQVYTHPLFQDCFDMQSKIYQQKLDNQIQSQLQQQQQQQLQYIQPTTQQKLYQQYQPQPPQQFQQQYQGQGYSNKPTSIQDDCQQFLQKLKINVRRNGNNAKTAFQNLSMMNSQYLDKKQFGDLIVKMDFTSSFETINSLFQLFADAKTNKQYVNLNAFQNAIFN